MNPSSWWSGTRLVAGRTIAESLASKSWRITTAIMLLLGIAAVVIPQLIGQDATTYKLTTVGEAPPQLVAMLQSAGQAGDFTVEVATVPDDAAAQAAVRDGDADVALTGITSDDTLFVASSSGGTFPVLVAQAAVAEATTDAMEAAGLGPEQVAEIQSQRPPEQVSVGRVTNETRAGIGFITGIVLYLALIIAGATIAGGVATEKSSRISEVLLAVLRPTQLLVGTVIGVGLMMLMQIAVLAVPVLIGLTRGSSLDIPPEARGDVVLAIVWFVLGLLLYAFVFAALGALVDKPTEVGPAILPANAILIGAYLLGVIVTVQDPNTWVSVAASLFPFSAPLVMPIRWASGLVPNWQLILAMALTLATAVGVAVFASRIYARGLTRTGRRLKVREVLAD